MILELENDFEKWLWDIKWFYGKWFCKMIVEDKKRFCDMIVDYAWKIISQELWNIKMIYLMTLCKNFNI